MKKGAIRNVLLSLLLVVTSFLTSVHSAAIPLTGPFVQGGLLKGHTSPHNQVMLNQKPVIISATGHFIIGFGRDAALEHQLTVTDPHGNITEQKISIQQRNYQIERINGISKQMMHPSAEQLKRISAEATLVKTARNHLSTQNNYNDSFIWPLTGRISGIYGSQRIFNGEPRRPHFGIDIAAPSGTLIKAPAGGIVTLAHAGMFYSGQTLIIDHGLGLSSTFLHLSKILVSEGEQVKQGQAIAEVGATGRVTGPHLDWRINWFQTRLDPALLVPEMPAIK